MGREAIKTEHAPAAIGPYSQAIRIGGLLFCSGQIALDPKSGELVKGGIEAETRQVMGNLTAVLEAAGASWADVGGVTIYLIDLNDFATVNRVYGEHAGTAPPAR